jgi:tripartite ATP-independent transporter DctM subunit
LIDAAGEILAIGLFVSICAALLLGFPVAFTLAGTSLAFAALGWTIGQFDFTYFLGLPSRYFGVMTNEVLVAVPLFIFMGMILERSGIAEALLTTMGQLFGRLRGGLAYSVVIVGAILAASTGVVGATVVTMGLISLPAMLRAGYDPKLASGTICASATLSQLIPPSTVIIFIADILQGVNQSAQARMGNMAPTPVSVGDLFAGALLPGFLLVGLYLVWNVINAVLRPESCPPLEMTPEERRSLPSRFFGSLVFPLLLVLAVLGSILTGLATATESASIGASGAMVFAALRGRLSWRVLRESVFRTAVTTSMIFVILLGASVFSLVFRGLGGEALVEEALAAMPGGKYGAMIVAMLVMFGLGFFLDTFEIIFIMLPIFGPPLIMLGWDPVWLGVMIAINLQTSFLTPPFGFTLFYLRSIAPARIRTTEIWRGAAPFVGLQLLGLALLFAEPRIATWLPDKIFHSTPLVAAGDGPSLGDLLGPPDEGGIDVMDLFGGQGTEPPTPDSQGDPVAPQTGEDFFGPAPNADDLFAPASPPGE